MHPYLNFGRLHVPVYGVFAALGLVAAMLLSERTARMARVDAAGLWNAGMIAVCAAFVFSRMLLVLTNFKTFLQYPTLVLALPSLTRLGLVLTTAVTLLYVWWKRMPMRDTLDAAGPCLALLWGFLSLGLIAEGTREGMPSAVAWAVTSGVGRVHPVEAYSAVCGLCLCGLLLGMLRRRAAAGQVCGLGLALGGMMLFFTDFFRLPAELFTDAWLDAVQWMGVAMMVAGGLVFLSGGERVADAV